MYFKGERTWKRYPLQISAINNQSAIYLLHYISHVRTSACYLNLVEIIDLQRYKIIRKKRTIKKLLDQPEIDDHFVFPVFKN